MWAGKPDADNLICDLKPPVIAVVIFVVPRLPWAMETVFGEAEIEKPPAVTVKVTDVLFVMPPPVPVTVIGYVPVAVVEATVMVMVELPDPGALRDEGEKPTVTPFG